MSGKTQRRMKRTRLTRLIPMSMVALVAMFACCIFVWTYLSSMAYRAYNRSMQVSIDYNGGYTDILESKDALERFYTYEDEASYTFACEKLKTAKEKLGAMMENSEEGPEFRRMLTDLIKMVETCEIHNSKLYSVMDSYTDKYVQIHDVRKQYSLLSMRYSNGLLMQQRMLQNASDQVKKFKTIQERVTTTIIGFVLLASWLLVILVSRHQRQTIDALVAYAQHFSDGNLEIPYRYTINDQDFQPIINAINIMVDEIRASIDEKELRERMQWRLAEERIHKIKIEAELRKAQIKELQTKLNPHFLFNTMALITGTAYLEKAEKTRNLMEALSGLLRTTFNYSGITNSVDQEIENLNKYIFIQQERFEGRIEFHIHVDPNVKDAQMPTMVLQPIVENSIIHGLKDSLQQGRVDVRIMAVGDGLEIEVEDNGCGMDAGLIEQIRNRNLDTNQFYGLVAVVNRIELIYGKDRISFSIDSKPGEYTVVRLLIPRLEGNDQTDGAHTVG